MNGEIRIRFASGEESKYPRGTSLLAMAREHQKEYQAPIVAARVNNALADLQVNQQTDATVEFFDLYSGQGVKVYERSLSFVLIVAAQRLFSGKEVIIEHSLGNGVYFEWLLDRPVSETDVAALRREMSLIVAENLAIARYNMPLCEAIQKFEIMGNTAKPRLLRQIERDAVSLYSCDGIIDYFYGPMVPETGYLKNFELKYYAPGFVLLFPDKINPNSVPEFIDNPKLAQIFLEAEHWGELLGCPTVTQLNEELASGGFLEIMRVAEALHEKKVAAIADLVDERRQLVKLVMIAGPSSSGKTTFAQRLGIQLRVHGIRPVPISLDDYFLEREQSPKVANGDYDFESIRALDLPLFNKHLVQLLAGESVEPPHYNFKTGRREYPGKKIQVGPNHVLVVEGIHGLNPQLTTAVPRRQKMLIYVSALTQLAIDHHNRIPTTDTRLIRRIVRDNQFRSHDALQTLRMWPSVRSGEEVNIFPFQEEADVMFNSALIYEVSVLRRYAESLLTQITPEYPEYLEAKRLTGFLRHFRPAPDEQVPLNSILREFIGT